MAGATLILPPREVPTILLATVVLCSPGLATSRYLPATSEAEYVEVLLSDQSHSDAPRTGGDAMSVAERALLSSALTRREAELRAVRDGWGHPGSVRPNQNVLARAIKLWHRIIDESPVPPLQVNLNAGEDGSLQFSIFGPEERELSLTVSGKSRTIRYSLFAPGKPRRYGTQNADRVENLLDWLATGTRSAHERN